MHNVWDATIHNHPLQVFHFLRMLKFRCMPIAASYLAYYPGLPPTPAPNRCLPADQNGAIVICLNLIPGLKKVRRIINYIILFIFSSNIGLAQIDSAVKQSNNVIEEDKTETSATLILRRTIHNSFRIINGHGTPTLDKKQLEFCIQHRFGLLSSGYEGAWGLDQSNIRIGLDYGLNRNITIGAGRSGMGKTSNGYIKWGIVKPDGTNQYKTSITWLSDMAYVFEKNTTGLTPYYNTHRINYTHQLLVSRNFFFGRHMFMLQVAPTIVHRNLVETAADANDVP
ncbi:MAG: hypothetical protein RLZZ161_1526, partial [Bacteroidota bacterium]